MKRYTGRDEKGRAYICGIPQTLGHMSAHILAACEDAGLTPERIMELAKAEKRRIEGSGGQESAKNR